MRFYSNGSESSAPTSTQIVESMPSPFRTVALIGKYPTAQGGTPPEVLLRIGKMLHSHSCHVLLDAMTAEYSGIRDWPSANLQAIAAQADLAVVVGGDGTMLASARELAQHDIPLIGINQGHLGFITDIPLGEIERMLPPMLAGEYLEEPRSLLAAEVWRQGEQIFATSAMNEVVVNRGSRAGLLELRAEIDGHFVGNYRGDGLIVCTATGSTAYSLSAGGPLLHPNLGGFSLVPIAPSNLSNRPLVLANSVHIALEVLSSREASANFDMQSLANLQRGDRIVLRRAAHTARFLHPVGWSYYDTLREKLHWNQPN